jgi:hypothetical protein
MIHDLARIYSNAVMLNLGVQFTCWWIAADIWFSPDSLREVTRDRLGQLGRVG